MSGDDLDAPQLGTEQPRAALTKDELLIASPSVRGYALKTKKWRELPQSGSFNVSTTDCSQVSFFIRSVRDIEWSESAFQSLVLPAHQKELVLAFAESQAKYKGAFDDVIQGKGLSLPQRIRAIIAETDIHVGKGMILLLSGPPGVGKTLTAESGIIPL